MEGTVIEPVPLLEERVDIEIDVGLKLDNTLSRKNIGDDFALACMFGWRDENGYLWLDCLPCTYLPISS